MLYLKLIRPLNLFIMALTMLLVRYCIIITFFGLNGSSPATGLLDFSLLVIATMAIAAGGYVINDYYDTGKDHVNRPGKVIVGKGITPGAAVNYYLTLTIAGVAAGVYISMKVDMLLLGFVFIAIALMLWFYTTNYQKTVLLGNIVIGFLSAMVILIVWIFEFFALRASPLIYAEVMSKLKIIGFLVVGYALFAFLISVVREVLKDCEDEEGDSKNGYRTFPVVAGVKTAANFAAFLALFSAAFLGYGQYWLFMKGYNLVFWYLMIAVQPLFIYLIFISFRAVSREDYRFASGVSKVIMLAGVLSMQLFCVSL